MCVCVWGVCVLYNCYDTLIMKLLNELCVNEKTINILIHCIQYFYLCCILLPRQRLNINCSGQEVWQSVKYFKHISRLFSQVVVFFLFCQGLLSPRSGSAGGYTRADWIYIQILSSTFHTTLCNFLGQCVILICLSMAS